MPKHSYPSLYKSASLLAAVFLGQAVLSFVQTYLFAAVGERVVLDLRTRLYEQMQRLPLQFFAKNRSGELVSRLMNDVGQMRLILTSGIASSLSQATILVGAVVIVLVIDVRFTLFIFSVAAVVTLLAKIFGRFIQKGSIGLQDALARATVVAEEAFQGIRVVKAFGREQYEVFRFSEAAGAAFRGALRQAMYQSSMTALMTLMGFGSLGTVILYGVHEVVVGRLSLGILTGFLMYGMMIAGSLSSLSILYGQLSTVLGAVHRVFEILDLKSWVADSPQAVRLSDVEGRIEFDNVSFGYENNHPVLHGIALSIQAGEILALVGPSGAGKSTLFNLIPRFYDPTSGRIRIDGCDLRSVTQASLRSQIAIVPQDPILFGGTIRENILYGRLEATEADVVAAAMSANAHNFIMRLPQQYDTIVGERGANLSGGERQRIAIARAILKDPRILLLDEATNSLDHESEALVQDALDHLMQRRTAVIIAHRLSTIRAAHRIAVVNCGRIDELGSHAELMTLNGFYARSFMSQFGKAQRA
jgi:subfamily B ATP-binding cassette protein MsbA